jgi:hypothetical protein
MTVHMAANPHLVNGLGRDLDIVLEYVEVLSKVNTEGSFDFISKELDDINSALAAEDFEAKDGDEGVFKDMDTFSEDGEDNDEYGYSDEIFDDDNEDIENEDMNRGDILNRGAMLGTMMILFS